MSLASQEERWKSKYYNVAPRDVSQNIMFLLKLDYFLALL